MGSIGLADLIQGNESLATIPAARTQGSSGSAGAPNLDQALVARTAREAAKEAFRVAWGFEYGGML